MYWGSVKFYKHIILTSLALIFIIPSILALNFYFTNSKLTDQLDGVRKEYGKLEVQMAEMKEAAEYAGTFEGQLTGLQKRESQFELPYQDMYPELYIGEIPKQTRSSETVFLSFDDGPSDLTIKVLDVLKEKDVKATFFVIGKQLENPKGVEILKRITREGHAIGVHCYNHVYKDLYESVESFLEDFNKVFMQVYEITGEKPEILRFPGGSINGYNRDIYQALIAELMRRGFVYYDWNVSSGDSDSRTNTEKIYADVVGGIKRKPRSIVLMHDTNSKTATLNALPRIIDEVKENGYEFGVISRETTPVIFVYRD